MHKEEWSGVRAAEVAKASEVHIRNVMQMALDDIAELQRIREAAEELADYYRRSVNAGPGPNPTRESILWGNLRYALGERP